MTIGTMGGRQTDERTKREGVNIARLLTFMRRFLAGLSACGIAVGIAAYVESLSGTTIGERAVWMFGLGVGVIAVQIPMFVLERPSLQDRTFFWKGFARSVPRSGVFCVKLFWLIAVAHFIWFFAKNHYAVPLIKDGQSLLSSRGRIVKVLTEQEYLTLKAEELREFAALMIACYIAPMLYWWFPRSLEQAA
jgi:hypothetical protein